MTKILYIPEGIIIQLIKYPIKYPIKYMLYTPIYEETAFYVARKSSPEELITYICDRKNGGYIRSNDDLLKHEAGYFVRGEFEIIYD